MLKQRLIKFRKMMKKENLDAFLLTRHASIRYLSGFTGGNHISPDAMMVVTPKKAVLLTDSRYWEQASKDLKGVRLERVKGAAVTGLENLKELNMKNIRIGFESEFISYEGFCQVKKFLPRALFIPATRTVEEFSAVKDKDELKAIERACEITDIAFGRILGYLKPGLREMEVAAELEYQMKMLGAEAPAFETIVASGWRSALPHGVASSKKIARGDFVTFDFGAIYDGYCSDMTRTVVIGKANARQKKIYNIVLKAQAAAIRKIISGAEASKVDAVARTIIKKAGYEKNFGHGLGHGIGLYIHSAPGLGPKSQDILKRGMVVTVEPGVYIPKWGGVRIEDDVAVTTRGGRILTESPKKLLEI